MSEEMTPQEFGSLVRLGRMLGGLTQQELAAQAHLSAHLVGRIERGQSVSLPSLVRVAEACSLDPTPVAWVYGFTSDTIRRWQDRAEGRSTPPWARACPVFETGGRGR